MLHMERARAAPQTPSSISSNSTASYVSDDDSDFITSERTFNFTAAGVNPSIGLPHSSLHKSKEEWGNPMEGFTPAAVKLLTKSHRYKYIGNLPLLVQKSSKNVICNFELPITNYSL